MVIWLHDVEGYTHKEIGELTGQTASYSKSQLARGYGNLTQIVQGDRRMERKPTISDLLALRDGESADAELAGLVDGDPAARGELESAAAHEGRSSMRCRR
jgi:hypothetical protein